jgi:pyrroline-5-carboxylate reductase
LAQKLKGKVYQEEKISFDAVILGFKPQQLEGAKTKLLETIHPHATIISLLAAVTLKRLKNFFSANEIIRVMPNLMVEKNDGVAIWSSEVESQAINNWSKALSSLGLVHKVSEPLLDVYTLHAGCSPAFIFSWLKSAEEFAILHSGEAKLAREILIKSWLGALESIQGQDVNLEEKINSVASKGGVTRAALDSFQAQAPNYVVDAFEAGLSRINELKS